MWTNLKAPYITDYGMYAGILTLDFYVKKQGL